VALSSALAVAVMYTLQMSHRYSIAEARSQLPRIVNQAESGVEIELTRRGRPVAVLVSHREFERLRGRHLHFRDAYRQFLKIHSPRDMGVEDDFAASARNRTTGSKVSL
jgi:prevent-host-death family protein